MTMNKTGLFIDMLAEDVSNPIVIPSNYVYATPTKDMIVKNQVKAVEWQDYAFGTEIDTPVANHAFTGLTSVQNEGDTTNQSATIRSGDPYLQNYVENKAFADEEFVRLESRVVNFSFNIPKTVDIKSVYAPKDEETDTFDKYMQVKGRKYNFVMPSWLANETIQDGRDIHPVFASIAQRENSILNKQGNDYPVFIDVSSEEEWNKPISSPEDCTATGFMQKLGGTPTHSLPLGNQNTIGIQSYPNHYAVGCVFTTLIVKFAAYVSYEGVKMYKGEVIVIDEIQVTINGDKCVLNLRDEVNRRGDTTSAKKYTLPQNELIQQTAMTDKKDVTVTKTGTTQDIVPIPKERYGTITVEGVEYGYFTGLERANGIDKLYKTADIEEYTSTNWYVQAGKDEFTATFQWYSVGNYAASELLAHYSDGLATARLTVVYMDYFYSNGEKAIDKSLGQIFKIGDIVRVEKDSLGAPRWTYADGSPMIFKVTGVNIRYEGVIKFDLELKEIAKK